MPSTYGQWGWRTGPTPTYKFGDQWVVSDRMLVDVQYSHVGNNFILDYHDPSLATVQPYLIVSTSLNGRSTPDGSQSVNIRPVNAVNVNMNYFMPGTMGGDHALKVGGYWKDANSYNSTHTPRQRRGALPDLVHATTARSRRRPARRRSRATARPIYDLLNISAYVQDTYHAQAADDAARPPLRLQPRPGAGVVGRARTRWCRSCCRRSTSPAPIRRSSFHNFSPRLGFTYDLTGDGKTLAARQLRDVLRPGRHRRRVRARSTR